MMAHSHDRLILYKYRQLPGAYEVTTGRSCSAASHTVGLVLCAACSRALTRLLSQSIEEKKLLVTS